MRSRRSSAQNRVLPEAVIDRHPASCRRNANPMDALRTGVSMLGANDPTLYDNEPDLDEAIGLAARFPAILATFFRHREGLEPIQGRADFNTAQNYLYQLFGKEPEERHWKPLETYLVLLADHGLNASTFTARVIASTDSDLSSALTGAVGALKGPAHGGAPAKVLDMLNEIGSADNVEPWLTNALDTGQRLMGFGHRVYKAEDPRAEILRGMAETASTPEFFALSEEDRGRALAHAGRAQAGSPPLHQRRVLLGGGAGGGRAAGGHVPADLRRGPRRSAGRPTCWSRAPTTGSSGRPANTSAQWASPSSRSTSASTRVTAGVPDGAGDASPAPVCAVTDTGGSIDDGPGYRARDAKPWQCAPRRRAGRRPGRVRGTGRAVPG